MQESIESQKKQLQNDYKQLQTQYEVKVDKYQKKEYTLQFQIEKLEQDNKSLSKKLGEEQELNYYYKQSLLTKEEELLSRTRELHAQVSKLETDQEMKELVQEIYISKQKVIAQIEEHKREKEMYRQMAQEREKINQTQNQELLAIIQSKNALEQRLKQPTAPKEQDAQLAELVNWNYSLKDKVEELMATIQDLDTRLSGYSNVE